MRRSITSNNNNSTKSADKMDLPKLQTRTASTFPPPHKTQLPMRYQTQHYQNPNINRSSSSCKRNAWIIGIILTSFFITMYLISMARGVQFSGQLSGSNKKGYGIIIDAGSSGSRIHVFSYTQGLIPAVDLVGRESWSLKRTPGLSSFAGMPKFEHGTTL